MRENPIIVWRCKTSTYLKNIWEYGHSTGNVLMACRLITISRCVANCFASVDFKVYGQAEGQRLENYLYTVIWFSVAYTTRILTAGFKVESKKPAVSADFYAIHFSASMVRRKIRVKHKLQIVEKKDYKYTTTDKGKTKSITYWRVLLAIGWIMLQ